jgi:hypothetical protein
MAGGQDQILLFLASQAKFESVARSAISAVKNSGLFPPRFQGLRNGSQGLGEGRKGRVNVRI